MKNTTQSENKSLKTFYLYIVLVIVVIIVSLLIKGIFIIKESKFDSAHDFTLVVTEQNNAKEIIVFHPQVPAVSILSIKDNNISYASLAKKYGISPDGYIEVKNNSAINTEVTSFMWSSIMQTENWHSNFTFFDKIRLLLLAKSVTTNDKTVQMISLINQAPGTSTIIINALTDQDIADENSSIQIVNTTEITGFGQRLGRVLTNMGANVVDVSTSQDPQKKSTIQYFGNKSYTVNRLEKLLDITATKINTQSIANIIITLGNDKSNTTEF